jgi:WD40 repeat protein
MDCEDVELLLAREARTVEDGARITQHVAGCSACRELTRTDDDRWIVRLPEDALDDRDLLVLPTIDPVIYTDERELARGGMGRITRVHDRRLGRDVAIKEVLEPRMRARFEREVAITAQLQHPAIVPVYEAGTWPDGSAFYSMRLVSGGTLADAIARTKDRLSLLPHVIATVDALAYAHAQGVVHRDLKPQNVLVGEFGETVVIDWGLAKVLGRDVDTSELIESLARRETLAGRDLTRAGSVLGTPGFMPPEQAAGGEVDARADVYALGAILRAVVCGAHDGPMPEATPADLRAIIERAMANDPTARFANAQDMAAELRRFQAGQLLASRRYTTGELVRRWLRRHRVIVTAALLALAAIAIIGVVAFVNITRSRATAESTVTSLLEEQGRAALVAGEPERAATLLVEAYRRGAGGVAMRHMLVAATRDLDLDARRIAAPSWLAAIGFTAEPIIIDGDGITTGGVTKPFPNSVAAGLTTISADSRWVAIFAEEKLLHVYDVASGALLWTHAAGVGTPVRFGGTRIAFGLEGSLVMHDATTGAFIAKLGPADAKIAFSPDGARVATCSKNELVVRDAAGTQLYDQRGCDGEIAFAGDRLVVQTGLRTLEVWQGEHQEELPERMGTIRMLAATADRVIALDTTGTLTLFDITPEAFFVHATATTSADGFVMSHDRTRFAVAGPGERLQIYRTETLELVHAIALPQSGRETQLIAWSPDDSRLATAQFNDRYVMSYRTPRGARVQRIASTVAVATDTLLAAGGIVHRLATGEVIARLPVTNASVWHLSRDGSRALLVTDRDATVVDVRTLAVLAKLAIPPPARLQLSADGTRVLQQVWQPYNPIHELAVFDATTGARIRALTMTQTFDKVAFSPTGDRIVVLAPLALKLVDVATGAIREIPFKQSVHDVAFSPRGDLLIAFGALAEPSRIIEPATGRVVAELSAGNASYDAAIFDDAGARVLTWANDRTAQLWNARTGALLATVPHVWDRAIAITADGTRFATTSEAGVIQIWDASTARLLSTLPADRDSTGQLAWSADGTRLVSVSYASSTIWDLSLETRTAAQLAALPTGYRIDGGMVVKR